MKLFLPRVAGVAAGLLLVAPAKTTVDAATIGVGKVFSTDDCSGVPEYAKLANSPSCSTSSTCGPVEYGAGMTVDCTEDLAASLDTIFSSSDILVRTTFAEDNCTVGTIAYAFLLDDTCHPTGNGYSYKASAADGVATYNSFEGSTCEGSRAESFTLPSSNINSDACVEQSSKFYTDMTKASEAIATLQTAALGPVMQAYLFYHKDTCASTPSLMSVEMSKECTASTVCDESELLSGNLYVNAACPNGSDYFEYVASMYGETPYVLAEVFTDEKCANMGSVVAALADGSCYADYNEDAAIYIKYTLATDGSVILGNYNDSTCTTETTNSMTVTSAQVEASTCFEYGNTGVFIKLYTSLAASTSTLTSSALASMKLSTSLAQMMAGLVALVGVALML